MKSRIALMCGMIAVAAADNCATLAKKHKSGPHTMKADLKDLYCTDAGKYDGGCSGCCAATPGTCYALKEAKTKCGDMNFYADKSKYSILATTANYKTNCCKQKDTCTGYKCAAANMKDKANLSAIHCDKDGCTAMKCCDNDQTKCLGAWMAGNNATCASGKTVLAADQGMAVKSDFSDFAAKCCKATPARATCDITCPAGMANRANYATLKCMSSSCSVATADLSTCCGWKNATCAGVMGKGVPTGKGCDTATEFTDKTKDATAAKVDGSDYKANCCTKKDTCAAFAAQKLKGTTSLADTQQASAVLLLVLVGGSLALGN